MIKYQCDAADLAQVTGMAMAIDYREAHGTLPARLQALAPLIQAHARALTVVKQGEDVDIPLNVSASIYTAVNALSEH
jgi:hypothetical protein